MPAELVVGLVNHQQEVLLQQSQNDLLRHKVAGRIVGRGQEDGLRARLNGILHRAQVYVVPVVPRDGDQSPAVDLGAEGVHPEGWRAVDNPFLGLQCSSQQQVDKLVGPGSYDNVA